MIGTTIGNYRITERIGGGGIGEVWKAVDLGLDRLVAIKALRPEMARREQVVARFRSEAQTLARLSHPNIATLHSLLESGDSLFMVMEYVEGHTLSALIRAAGRFDLDTAFEVFQQALDGIGHAHDVGVIHRDIKGSNLMVDGRGTVKIMDFGIARVMGSDRMTRHGNLVGTPEFMSPEQVRGEEATIQSDIYSLGVLLYEMLTGRVPFRMKGDFDLMQAQVQMAPPPPRSLAPEIPEAIEGVMLRALEKRPENRYRTTRSFQAALEKAGAPPRGSSSTGELVAALGKGTFGDPEEPTLETDAGDSASARITRLILEEDAEDEGRSRRAPSRSSYRWTRLAAGIALIGLALGANVLRIDAQLDPAASAPVASAEETMGPIPSRESAAQSSATPAEPEPPGSGPARADPGSPEEAPLPGLPAATPAGGSGPKADRAATARPKPARPRARAAGRGEPKVRPKKPPRSSEENPGWVIRRE